MITFNQKNQVVFMVDSSQITMEKITQLEPSFRRSASQISQGFQGFGEALWYKAKGAGRAVSGAVGSMKSSIENTASFVEGKITGAVQYAENKITSAVKAAEDTIVNVAEAVKEKASDIIQPIYDTGRNVSEEIDASKINKENKRDIEAARKQFKKVEKYSLSIDKLQERIASRDKEMMGVEKKFDDKSTEFDNLRGKIKNGIQAQDKLNDLKLERVKIEGLEGDIKRLNEKIDKLNLKENKSQKETDLLNELKNTIGKKQEQKGDKTLEGIKTDIRAQKEAIKTQENEIKKAKTALANEIGGGFKGRSEVNKYESLIKSQNGLEKEKNEKISRGAEHFQKAEQVLKVDAAKGEGVMTKLEQKVREVKEHDARYKGTTWEKIKDAALGAANYVKQGGAADFIGDLKRKIFGASGEKGRDEVANKVENLENTSLGYDKKGMHSIVEKVQERDAVKMAQQVGKDTMPTNQTTEMSQTNDSKNAQQKPRDVFRGSDTGTQR